MKWMIRIAILSLAAFGAQQLYAWSDRRPSVFATRSNRACRTWSTSCRPESTT